MLSLGKKPSTFKDRQSEKGFQLRMKDQSESRFMSSWEPGTANFKKSHKLFNLQWLNNAPLFCGIWVYCIIWHFSLRIECLYCLEFSAMQNEWTTDSQGLAEIISEPFHLFSRIFSSALHDNMHKACHNRPLIYSGLLLQLFWTTNTQNRQ